MEGTILSRFLVASSKASGQGRGAVPETLGSMPGPPWERKPMRLWPVCSSFWIRSQEVLVRTDHSSIVKWYKEDLCTISGPSGRRGRWHEFLSRFNLTIRYQPGDENDGTDALSRWAYPGGVVRDTNFHGSTADMEAWGQAERAEWERLRAQLRAYHPEAFQEEHAMVQLLQDVYRTVASLQDLSGLCVASDGCEFASQEALFCHVFDCSQDQAACPVPQSDPHQEEAMCLSRHI